jgi:hypothetical protein
MAPFCPSTGRFYLPPFCSVFFYFLREPKDALEKL